MVQIILQIVQIHMYKVYVCMCVSLVSQVHVIFR